MSAASLRSPVSETEASSERKGSTVPCKPFYAPLMQDMSTDNSSSTVTSAPQATSQSAPLRTDTSRLARPANRGRARQQPFRQPAITTPPLWRSGRPFLVFSFLLMREFFNWYCTVNKIGPVRTPEQQLGPDTFAIQKIRFDAKLRKSDLQTVYTGHEAPDDFDTCLVIGTNYTEEDRDRPDEALIKRIQAAMGVDMEPMWYHLY